MNTFVVGQPPCFLCSPGSLLAYLATGEPICKLCPTNFSTIRSGGLALLMLLVLFFVNQRFHWFSFKNFDILYSAKHPLTSRPKPPHLPKSQMWKEFYVTEWTASVGGLFSLLCIIVCIMVTLLLTLPYKYDNVTELQSLVSNPSIPPAERTAIHSDLVVAVNFHGYGDDCNVGARESSSTV